MEAFKREQGRALVLHAGCPPRQPPPGARYAQQRLLGPASGDLARTRFAEDYAVEAATPDAWEGQAATRLELRARRPALSWRTAHLWVAQDGRPLAGAFFLPSGKQARTVRFEAPVIVNGARLVPGLTLRDSSGQETRLAFDRWAPGPQEPARFALPEAL